MTSNKDDQNKPGSKPGDTSNPKRPFATIDLKATEVNMKPAADAKATAAAASTIAAAAATAATKAASEPAPSQSRATAEHLTTAAANTGASKTSFTSTRADGASPSKGSAPTAATPESQRSGGGFFSHIVAGVAGALLTLGAGAAFWPSIAPILPLPAQTQNSIEITKRFAELERAIKERPTTAIPAEVTQKLAAADARIGKIEQSGGDVTAKIAAELKAAEERLAKQGAAQGSGDRIAKLEETLSALSSAAKAEPNSAGRIPQLAAITGKLSDLETALNNRTASLRQDVIKEVEARIASISEASEAAKTGTARIDRDVAGIKTDSVRLGQRTERIEQTLKSVQDEAGGFKAALDSLKSDVEGRMKQAAKPADIASALQPLTTKMASLEQNVQGVVKSEQDRNVNAERIVMSLELANLRRALDRGQKYSAELAALKKAGGEKLNLAALEAAQNTGVPAMPDLAQEFRKVANAVLDVDAEQADASVVDRLWSGAKSIVRVRKVNHGPDDKGTEATVGRMDMALRDNRLSDVLDESKKLPPRTAAPAQDWIKKIEARAAVDKALASIEAELKSSLSGGKGTK